MVMPKMGESIMEGTVTEWKKKVGDYVEQDETVLEIATDKVDSEVPAPIAGTIVEILVEEGETVEVGTPIAIIDTEGGSAAAAPAQEDKQQKKEETAAKAEEKAPAEEKAEEAKQPVEAQTSGTNGSAKPAAPVESSTPPQRKGSDGRFYSPLVRSIAQEEGISQEELESIEGSGSQGRVSKKDLLNYIDQKKSGAGQAAARTITRPGQPAQRQGAEGEKIRAGEIHVNWPRENVEVIQMDRMRKSIAEHMIRSKQTSAHVTTFAEADVTPLVRFRDKNKKQFLEENGFKLTFTPFFIEATIQAIREFPLINSSVDGDKIILKRDINYGIAVSLGESGSGGLIVPVIKNAGEMNIHGLARSVYSLAQKARSKSLSPDDLTGGTFTLTNYGSVGNLAGTPIINQPQVAIFGTGAIVKRPVVLETAYGDTIAIRHMMFLSLSYDHRVVDGFLGGSFLRRVADNMEAFDVNRAL